MIRLALVGVGKMGLSHLAIANMHPGIEVAGVCESSGYVRGVLGKYTGLPMFGDYERMLAGVELDAVIVATPSRTHTALVRLALERGLHVFCEKPLALDPSESEQLAALASERGVVTQVGYHHRFLETFREVRTLLDAGAIGTISSAQGEAYGPVVLKRKGGTWRSRKTEGGGSLYDYAAHPIDLLNWYRGEPVGVGATAMSSIFSREIDDEVISTLFYADGSTSRVAVNWSDESCRKMTTKVTLWGTGGRIYADRQECQVYLRGTAPIPPGYQQGWNVRYTTELTEPVGFYLRGEEYSAQLDEFVARVGAGDLDGLNGFSSAAATDRVIAMMIADAEKGIPTTPAVAEPVEAPRRERARRFRLPRPKRHGAVALRRFEPKA